MFDRAPKRSPAPVAVTRGLPPLGKPALPSDSPSMSPKEETAMKALTHHQTSAKRFPRVASKEDTRPTQRNGCQIAVNTQRLEDHVDTGMTR